MNLFVYESLRLKSIDASFKLMLRNVAPIRPLQWWFCLTFNYRNHCSSFFGCLLFAARWAFPTAS